ncbi:MAG: glucose-6-phosphate isomerase [Candidatus Parabeggiatoa sp. nov. 2]|nr:MAG: glucose-6-phosphate isomerase [Beggiatoa sp. 4572_84]RKZ64184.1 MAG: glucose-6-phosphate isomerase [Gammaproteobacteria bacterium]HEC85773.1 glucose-6-phosphate isomerase [Thioploca sp.]
MDKLISHSAAWAALKAHQHQLAPIHLRDLFAEDSQRFERFSVEACGLLLDYSKNRLTRDTLSLLLNLATEAKLQDWIARLFQGEKVNNTEQRAALHIALRNRSNRPIRVDGKNVMPDINAVLAKMRQFSDSVRGDSKKQWRGYTGKPIESIVNIGIGGSDLGPAMVTRALKAYHHPRLRSYFVSNVDSTHLGETLAALNPETTLFIVASKTFTTQETLLNATSARQWLIDKLGDNNAVAKHFVAVSTATQQVTEFGIDPINMFEFWDWVGGRYSLWSAIGLPIAVMIGMNNFEQLLAGAHEMDTHFETAPFAENLPVLMGLIGVWYSRFLGATTHAVLPYDYCLELFPAHLQQLIMESLGKRVTRDGKEVDYPTGPIIWGTPGNNGQHAFYQLLHQGTHLVPADFIIAIESQYDLPGHQNAVLSNALAQTHALMMGRTAEQTKQALYSSGITDKMLTQQLPHRVFQGNQPSNTLVYKKLTPQVLGKLLALYEHKVYVQGICWGINPFDQWGVELGKQVASTLMSALRAEKAGLNGLNGLNGLKETAQAHERHDSSTDGLLNYIKAYRHR